MIDPIREGLDWLVSRENTAAALITIITLSGLLLAPPVWAVRYWLARPRLAFRLEKTTSDDEAAFTIMNLGQREAKDVKIRWVRRSGMDMESIPQPTVIQAGESLPAMVTIDRLALLAHGTGFLVGNDDGSAPLGWIEVTYTGLVRRKRTGRSIVFAGSGSPKALASCLGLSGLPRRTALDAFPWLVWLDQKLGFARRRQEKADEQRAQADEARLRAAHSVLEENGIDLDDSDQSAQSLFGELSRRGWEYEYGPGGVGYETIAKKKWYPSTSMTLHMTGETLQEAATLALAEAIKSDQEHGTPIGAFSPFPQERDPLNFSPGDPRHDMDWY